MHQVFVNQDIIIFSGVDLWQVMSILSYGYIVLYADELLRAFTVKRLLV